MTRIFAITFVIIFSVGCKNEADELSGDKPVKAENFLKAFPVLRTPVIISDTGLVHFGDTTIISYSVLSQFIPDSVLTAQLGGQSHKAVIHPAGAIRNDNNDYLLAKFTLNKRNELLVFVLGADHKYVTSLALLSGHEAGDAYNHSVSVTVEPTFIIRQEKAGKDNQLLYSRHGFAFNNASKNFTEVMNESNEQERTTDVINPIDTFPATNKFSGQYVRDDKNFISVRDGKDAVTYAFFMHFEKNNGECTGELKGQMSLTDEKNAVYQQSGDPCVIHFKFSASSIMVKEEGNCGNHRGITCPFDFTFKKNTKSAK